MHIYIDVDVYKMNIYIHYKHFYIHLHVCYILTFTFSKLMFLSLELSCHYDSGYIDDENIQVKFT